MKRDPSSPCKIIRGTKRVLRSFGMTTLPGVVTYQPIVVFEPLP